MRTFVSILASALLLLVPAVSFAGDDGKDESGLTYTVNTLFFGDAQSPAHSTQNPENAFLDLYRYSMELEVRPDITLERPFISAVCKPRFASAYRWWEDGITRGMTDPLTRAFVNEWRVQAKAASTLFLSFGKEKLMWGPSFLASPSNILFKDTEKANPKTEVEGKYLAKLLFVPNAAITVSAVAETQKDDDERRQTIKPLHLVKADLLGGNYLVSAIAYQRQDDRVRLGSFGQWTASDALLLYYDGIVSRGTDALYPVAVAANPLGGTFVKQYDGSGRLFTTAIAGGSYTFLSGDTLSMEFLYNGQGYTDAEAREYYVLRRSASNHFFDGGALSGLSQQALLDAFGTGSPFLRRYYLMGQFQVREIGNKLDLIVRYTQSLEEHAGQASTILEWQLSDRIRFFNVNMIGVNSKGDREYNALLSKSAMAGIEVHY
jgi:hypothetical protein